MGRITHTTLTLSRNDTDTRTWRRNPALRFAVLASGTRTRRHRYGGLWVKTDCRKGDSLWTLIGLRGHYKVTYCVTEQGRS